jgi:transcriptional regulator with XRE-family HTH domain
LPRRYAEIAKRLEYIQTDVLKYKGIQMATALGIPQNTWSNYKNGVRRITVKHAERLCDIANAALRGHPDLPQVTLEFIYRGELVSKSNGMRYRVKFKKET